MVRTSRSAILLQDYVIGKDAGHFEGT